MTFRRFIAGVGIGVLALALLLPARARAATCNGFIAIDYPTLTGPVNIGDTVDVRIFFAAGSIVGGTKIAVDDFFFNLACDAQPPPAAPISPFALGADAQGHPLGCKDDPAKPMMF